MLNTKLITVLIIILKSISCLAQDSLKNDLKDMELKGRIKSIRQNVYTVDEDKLPDIQKGERDFKFNIYQNYTIFFDDKGNKTEETHCNINYLYEGFKPYDTVFYYRTIYTYNDKGNLKEADEYKSNNYKTDGILDNRMIYKYNENDKWDEYHIYNADSTLSGEGFCEYDGKNVIREIAYYIDMNFHSETFNKYDDSGNIIETNSCSYYTNGDTTCSKCINKYDPAGEKIEEHSSSWFGIVDVLYKYDNNGNIIEEFFKGETGAEDIVNTYEYKYDAEGNWTEKREYKNRVPKYIFERKIVYY